MIQKLATRRSIQIILGLLWLLDGLLQLQKQMFTSHFANLVIAPAAQGQPLIVSGPIHFEIHVLLMHPALFNAAFAIIQLALGLLILFERTTKAGLISSIIWASMVWYLGEGLGGLLGLHTILLMGAPGAVIIYGILAFAVLPKHTKNKDESTRPAFWLPLVWSALWVGGAIYQLLPGQNSAPDVSSMILNNADSAPSWLASIDIHASNFINHITHNPTTTSMQMSAQQMSHMQSRSNSGFWFIAIVVVVQLLIGVLILLPKKARKIAINLGVLVSLIFWVVGQSLGEYYSGLATDPNTAPLIIILGIAILGCQQIGFRRLCRDSYKSLEKLLT